MTPKTPSFVFFDAGYTLLRPTPSVGFHYARVAREQGFPAPDAAALDAAFIPAWKAARRAAVGNPTPYGRHRGESIPFWAGVVEACFQACHMEPPPRDARFYEVLYDAFAEARCWSLYPDVLPALAALDDAGIPYGVLSNWDERLPTVLGALGLLPRLRVVLCSCHVGAEKPDPAIFAAAGEALRAAGLEATRPALIGDEPEADGHGAQRAGWGQCVVWRRADAPPTDVATESDLVRAVERLLQQE